METTIYDAPKTVTTDISKEDTGLTAVMINHLAQGRKWGKFIAIVCFILAGLMAFTLIAGLFSLTQTRNTTNMGIANFLPLLFIIIAIFLYFRIGQFLLRYNTAIRNLEQSRSLEDLANSQTQFHRLCKWFAIIFTITFIISIIFFALVALTGLGSMMYMN